MTATRTWEELTSEAREARADMDSARWIIGDIANEAVTLFARTPNNEIDKAAEKVTLTEFAKEIGEKYKTVCQRRQIAAFYPRSTRGEYENLTYTHYRDAMRFKTLAVALAFLDEASANGYTTDEAAYHVNKRLGESGSEPLIAGEMTVDEAIARLLQLDHAKVIRIAVKDATNV